VADDDVMRPEHAVELFQLLPHAQLAVLPNTDHMARRPEIPSPLGATTRRASSAMPAIKTK
jgi:hypothetical protein